MSNGNRVSEVRTIQHEPGRWQRLFSFKTSQWIWLLFYVIEILIALRIIMKLMAANPDSPIAVLIYGLTSFLLIPFAGLISSQTIGTMVLETSSLFAIGVYALAIAGLERLVWLIFYRPRSPIVGVTETSTNEHHTNQ